MTEEKTEAILSYKQLNNFHEDYRQDKKNLLAQTTCCQQSLTDVIVNRQIRFGSVNVFNTKLSIEGRPVTNQKSSGRCWIFACLNVIRIQLMKALKISELELSQNYLFYYDKIERCHYFLMTMIDLAKKKEPIHGRLVQYLLKDLLIDGGQWDMLVNLINKYGVVPKNAFPESSSSEAALFMNKFLRTKLRGYTQEIFELVEQGNINDSELMNREAEMMKEIHRIITTCLGSPPEQITFEYYDTSRQYQKIGPFSPIEFYKQIVKPVFNMDNKVCLVHDPRVSNAYGRLYTVEYLGNIVGGQKTLYNNQPIRVLKQAVYDSIAGDEAVWFGVDFGKHMHAKYGILDLKIFDTQLYFNSDFPCQNKASRLEYGESLMTHAMVFTGVHVEKRSTNENVDQTKTSDDEKSQRNDLQFIRYRVENSHGDDKADKGYLIMTDDWFNEYLYEVVVDKKYLSKDVVAVLEQEPIVLKPWDPMGALASFFFSTQTESIIDLYKRINEKGSLIDGLSLNKHAQKKLKTIDTIRLLPLKYISKNRSSLLLFNINLNKIRTNEEIHLIEFRLKLKIHKKNFHRRKLTLIIRKEMHKKQRFHPLIISNQQSEYLSYDLTDYLFHNSSHQTLIIRRQLWIKNYLQQASLVIYSRTPGVFLLPSPTMRTKRSIKQKQITGPCSRHDLFVDFNQLSFGAWVVEPKKFNAGICRGDCPNPLSRLYYPSNHAMLLSLLHERGNSVQQPSCVPVHLRPLDLLYYDRRELVIKRHQGMQVEECGCR